MKFPFHPQLDSNDCGPACLQMILSYFGKKFQLRELKALCNPELLGVTIQDLSSIAIKLGLNTECVLVDIEEMKEMPLPAILYWKQSHFVVLYRIATKKNHYYIADPSFGKMKMNENEFFENWIGANVNNTTKGISLLFEEGENFKNVTPMQISDHKSFELLGYISKVIKKHLKSYIFSLLLMCISLLLSWAIPIIFQRIIDDGISSKNIPLIQLLILGQAACAIGYVIFITLYEVILLKINFNVSTVFLKDFLDKIIQLPISFFLKRVSSDLLQRIQDLELFQRFITRHAVKFVITFASFVLYLTILSVYNITLLWIYTISSLIIVCWLSLFYKKRRAIDYARFNTSAEYKNNYFELVSGMPDIKINNASEHRTRKLQTILTKTNRLLLNTLNVENIQIVGIDIIDSIRNMIIIGLCSIWVVDGKISIGEMLSINYIIGQLSGMIHFFAIFSRDYQDAKISLTRLNDINYSPKEIADSVANNIVDVRAGIYFKNVSFKYSSHQVNYVLNNLNFVIPKGKITAIVGASGSGKTTILKLILGFYSASEGQILLDDVNIDDVNINYWRSSCGVVLQDGYIFRGTISENIALSSEHPDKQRIKYAARIACIDTFIESLPMQYNSIIGTNGIMLSGGEKQRILIARAVYKDPEFLLMDEATNALDSNNEIEISNNLNMFFKDRTVIIIAHRLSTIRKSEQIIVLNKGEIVEVGKHDDLIKNSKKYYSLIKNQLELEKV